MEKAGSTTCRWSAVPRPHHGREGLEVFHLPVRARDHSATEGALLFYLHCCARAPAFHRQHRRQSSKSHQLDPRRVPGSSPIEARAADALRHGARGHGRRSTISTRAGHQQGDGPPALRYSTRAERIEAPAIILSPARDGETGHRRLTAEHGFNAAYCAARGEAEAAVLTPSFFCSDADRRLTLSCPSTIELTHSRAPLARRTAARRGDRVGEALTATALPERNPIPALFGARSLLAAIKLRRRQAVGAVWSASNCCSRRVGFASTRQFRVSGATDDLVAVSPRSGRAVIERCGARAGKLRPQPRFRPRGRARAGRTLPRPRPHWPFPDARLADAEIRGAR